MTKQLSEKERVSLTELAKSASKDPDEIIALSNGDVYRVSKFDNFLFIIARDILTKQIDEGWSKELINKFLRLENIKICAAPEWTGYTLSQEAANLIMQDIKDFDLLYNHYAGKYVKFLDEYDEKKRLLEKD